MRAIVLDRPGRLRAADVPPPKPPAPGHALVRVRSVGICGTDIHAYRGRQPFFRYPRILGHELGVEVLALGEGEASPPAGARAAVEPYLDCGRCVACRRGKPNCCAELRVLGVHVDGGMQEAIEVPVRKLHASETLSFDQLALIETLGIGAHATARARIEPGESVLVVGSGPIGLATIQFAKLAGARVAVLEVSPARLEFCRRVLGVEGAVPHPGDLPGLVRELSGGELPTAVFDATGHAESMMASFRVVAPGGRLVLVGLVIGEIRFDDPEFHRKELTLLATRNSTPGDFRRVLELVEADAIDTGPWITHRAGFDTIAETFPRWVEPGSGVIKAVLEAGADRRL